MRGIDTAAAVLPLRKSDANLPDAGRLVTALRQIGYSLEQAISDLVDNSINAGAQNVLIRFLHDGNSIQAVAIVDDGCGMDETGLHDAMRFGSAEAADVGTLGKFGMGLKLASLSHAQRLSVYTRKSGASAGRQWTLEGIREGWWCDRIQTTAVSEVLDRRWGKLDLTDQGTLVLWEELDKLPSHRNGLKYTLTSLETRLRLHLGLAFHRFLDDGSLHILVDQLFISRVGQGLQSEIAPLNPFNYTTSGHPEYPKVLSVDLSGIGLLTLEAHIWPPNSDSTEYRLGRRSASRQGFYYYRNHRLIQTGGWNGLLHDETEPHSSLARIKVDLPIEYDADFGINVQKSMVLVPPVFAEVLNAESEDGTSFEDFRRAAIQTYRSANLKSLPAGRYPISGFNKPVLGQLKAMYGKPSDVGGFRIAWSKLRSDEFFRLDIENQRLLLNRDFRGDDGALIKLLMSLLLRNDLAPNNKARHRELEQVNAMLMRIARP